MPRDASESVLEKLFLLQEELDALEEEDGSEWILEASGVIGHLIWKIQAAEEE